MIQDFLGSSRNSAYVLNYNYSHETKNFFELENTLKSSHSHISICYTLRKMLYFLDGMSKFMPIKSKVQYSLTKKDNSASQDYVNISTNFIEDSHLSASDKLCIFLGFGLHELSHIAFTDYSEWDRVKNNPLKRFLFNVIEDEYIERRLCNTLYLANGYLDKTKWFAFNFSKKTNSDSVLNKEGDHTQQLLNNILLYIRYPSLVDEEFYKDNKESFEIVREVLTSFDKSKDSEGYPSSSEDTAIAVEKIIDKLKIPSQEQEQEQSIESLMSALSEEGILNDRDNIIVNSFLKSNSKINNTEHLKILLDAPLDNTGVDSNSIFLLPKVNDRASYSFFLSQNKDILENANKLATTWNFFSKAIQKTSYNQNEGVLNKKQLKKIITGESSLFLNDKEEKIKALNLVIVIDLSGSMSMDMKYENTPNIGSRIYIAKKIAATFYEAAMRTKWIVPYIYGHNSICAEDKFQLVTVLKIFTPRDKYPNVIADLVATQGNCDGYALSKIDSEIKKIANPRYKTVYFIISDGEPVYEKGLEHTKEAIDNIEKRGCFVHQLSIGHEGKSDYLYKSWEKVFTVEQAYNSSVSFFKNLRNKSI